MYKRELVRERIMEAYIKGELELAPELEGQTGFWGFHNTTQTSLYKLLGLVSTFVYQINGEFDSIGLELYEEIKNYPLIKALD